MIEFSTFGPLLLSAGLMLTLFAIFGRSSKSCRALAAVLCIFLLLRYLWWHATLGMPTGQSLLQQAWAWIQTNLLCASAWPDEQRFFFEILMPAKDAWGAAFCCGTSAVFRVAALLAAEGMATETVTEDMLTSFKMEEHGYRTIYLNEPLSMGLSPEGLQAYITQRSRWCLGAIQQIYTRWSFAGRARMRLISRLSSFDTAIYWIFTFPFKILMLTAPLVFWWTGTAVIATTASGLIYWLAPPVVGGIIFMSLYGRNRVLPVMTDVSQLLPSFVILQTVVTSLTRPFGRPFKVTPKGTLSGGILIQWSYLLPFALAALGTFLGILINTSAFAELNGTPGFEVNVFWSIYDIAILLLAATVCIELPQQRQEARFPAKEQAVIRGLGQPDSTFTIADISLGGAKIAGSPPAWAEEGEKGVLLLDGGALRVPFRFMDLDRQQHPGQGFPIIFETRKSLRRALTRKLFGGAYRGMVDEIDVPRVLFALVKRLFR